MAEMETMKRARAPNFTPAEISLLLSLIDKYKFVIENRRTDGASINDKNKAWMKILQEFNGNSTTYIRTVESIQACYRSQRKKKEKYSGAKMQVITPTRNIFCEKLVNCLEELSNGDWDNVGEIKKEDSYSNLELRETDVGIPSKQPREILERVKELIGSAVDSLYTIYDNDSNFKKKEQEVHPQNDSILQIENELMSSEEEEEVKSAVTVFPASPQAIQSEWSGNALKRKRDHSLLLDSAASANDPLEDSLSESGKGIPHEKKNVPSCFMGLTERRMELVEIQKQIAILDLREKTKQSEHNCTIRRIEQQIKEAELELLQSKLKRPKQLDKWE